MASSMVGRIAAKRNPYKARNPVADIALTALSAEAANARTASLQLKDFAGANVAVRTTVELFLSDDAAGDSMAAAAASGGIAGGTNGHVTPVVTGKMVRGVTEANGTLDVTITEAGVKSFFLIAILPDGTLKALGAVAFA